MKLMKILEPITAENLNELRPGEWIWDRQLIVKNAHKRTMRVETIIEPVGFRQIHILNVDDYPRKTTKPFLLSDSIQGGNFWTEFKEGIFFRIKREFIEF